jgi:hypothetical protein
VIRANVHAKELEAALARLPRNVAEAAEKRALRAALKPSQDRLRTAWLSTGGRRGLHRKAIAASTRIDARRSGSSVVARVGVDYRFQAGRRAHQRVWHLLEAGFRHFGSSPVYAGAGAATATSRKSRSAFIRAQVERVSADLPRGRGSKAARRAALMRARQAASAVVTEQARKEASAFGSMRTAARATARRIVGRWISKQIADTELAPATERAAVLMLEEARKELAK